MVSPAAASLMLQAEKALPTLIRPELFAYCPTMDMIAVVTEEEVLEVYRLNGQRAITRKRKEDTLTIESICWKFNGKSIAVAWSDCTVDVISTETGKVAPQSLEARRAADTSSDATRISCLAWESNFIDVRSVKSKVNNAAQEPNRTSREEDFTDDWDAPESSISLNDVIQGHLDLQVLDPTPDLPDQIALIDMERLLPKLSVLSGPTLGPFVRPTIQAVPEVFTSQNSLDAMFHSHHLEYANAIHALLLCHADGEISPKVYNSLDVTGVRLPEGWKADQKSRVVHTTHPYSRSHCLLMDVTTSSKFKLCIIPLTFRYISSAGLQVHLIGSKQQQLENLLRYIQECLRSISNFWYHSRDLPSKFIRNIDETLSEKGEDEGDLMQNLFHLAVTGHCPPLIKEWLVDELTESGHKRWDHSATQGYAKVIELTHENLIPSLDRAGVVVSLLRGLAAYDDSGSVFSVPASDFTNILETLKILRVLGHVILILAREERRQFVSFSRWLRDEIHIQASSSSTTEDTPERDSSVDYTLVLDFIRGPMSTSKLDRFLRRQPKIDPSWSLPSSLPTYDEICKLVEPTELTHTNVSEAADTWLSVQRLHVQCQSAFTQIARWQASNTSMSAGLILEDDEMSAARDMRMTETHPSLQRPDSLTTFVSAVPLAAENEIRLHRIVHPQSFDHITKESTCVNSVTITLPKGAIKDIKFVDDAYLMALVRSPDNTSYIISLPYADSSDPSPPWPTTLTASTLPIAPHSPAPSYRTTWDLSTPETMNPYVKHTFAASDRFVPLRIEVNGRKHRRVVCIVGEDLKHYKVFDLDWAEGDDGEKRAGEESFLGDGDVEMEYS